MAHVHRFHIPSQEGEPAEIALPEHEAHHALHVVRIRPGEGVSLFDGRGREWLGTVSRVTRREVTVSVDEDRFIPAPAERVTLYQAMLGREKAMEELVQRGTELGVGRFVVFRGRKSQRKARISGKWTRTAIEACKQCGGLWLPEFSAEADLDSALRNTPDCLLLATAQEAPVPIREAITGSDVGIIVGPEGDFANEELAAARGRGAVPISLGDNTFRAEVAGSLAAALVLHELGRLGPR